MGLGKSKASEGSGKMNRRCNQRQAWKNFEQRSNDREDVNWIVPEYKPKFEERNKTK